MEERRKYPRTEINDLAYVSEGGSIISCVVRNISPEGAAIDVEDPAFVPPRFRLVMADGTAVYECSVTWIQKEPDGPDFSRPRRNRIKSTQPRCSNSVRASAARPAQHSGDGGRCHGGSIRVSLGRQPLHGALLDQEVD